MNPRVDLLTRVIEVEKILSSDLSRKDKVIKSLNNLSGLEITWFKPALKKKIIHHFASLNDVTQHYNIKTFEDYSFISNAHLDELISIIQRICRELCKV